MSSGGLDIDAGDFGDALRGAAGAPRSTALHCLLLPDGRPYLVGPLARINLCRDRPAAGGPPGRRGAAASPFRSRTLVAGIVGAGDRDRGGVRGGARDRVGRPWPTSPRAAIDVVPRAGVGCHATEAPRGLLYHRYEIGADGLDRRGHDRAPDVAEPGADRGTTSGPCSPACSAATTRPRRRACEQLIRRLRPVHQLRHALPAARRGPPLSGRAQQIRGNCSPSGMGITRVPPIAVRIATSRGCAVTTRPIARASRPKSWARIAASTAPAASAGTTARSFPSLATWSGSRPRISQAAATGRGRGSPVRRYRCPCPRAARSR